MADLVVGGGETVMAVPWWRPSVGGGETVMAVPWWRPSVGGGETVMAVAPLSLW